MTDQALFLRLPKDRVIFSGALSEYMKKSGMKSSEADASAVFSCSFYKSFFHFRGSGAAEGKYEDLGRFQIVMIKKIKNIYSLQAL